MRKRHRFRRETWSHCVLSDRVYRLAHDYIDSRFCHDVDSMLDTFVGQTARDKTSPTLPREVRGPSQVCTSALVSPSRLRR